MSLFAKIVMGLLVLFIGLPTVFFYVMGRDDSNIKASGVTVADGWHAEKVCNAVYSRLSSSPKLTDFDRSSFGNTSCDVRPLSKPMPGVFAGSKPFSVVYSNAIAARVTVKNEELVIVGWSTGGPASSWYN